MKHNHKQDQFEEKVVRINRVSTKKKGGDTFGFSVLMVVGDRKGQVGVGLGKAHDVLSAIKKGVKKAKKNMIEVPIKGTTIPFSIRAKSGAGYVLLKPAVKGTVVIAGGPVRAVVEAAGIKDIVAKILGSDNQSSSVEATMAALKQINKIIKVRGIKVEAEKEEVKEENQEEEKKSKKASKKDSKKKTTKKASKKKDTKKTDEKKVAKKKAEKEQDKKEAEVKETEKKASKKTAKKASKKTKETKKSDTKKEKKEEKKSEKKEKETKKK